MKIKVNYLKAMMLFAARNDFRYYINGVKIEGNRMIATDGHRMTICNLGEDSGLNVILPIRDLGIALMSAEKSITGLPAEIEVTDTMIGRLQYKPIEGNYPDYNKLLPKSENMGDVDYISINPKYVADFAKMGKLVTGSNKYWAVSMRQAGKSRTTAVIVQMEGCQDFFSLVMPMDVKNPVFIPKWIESEEK